MNIGFDIDGVLYPWHEEVYKYIRENKRGCDRDFGRFWSNKSNYDWNPEQVKLFVYNPTFYRYGHPMTPPDILMSLMNKGHNIYYVSNRPRYLEEVTFWWLKFWEFPSPFNFFLTENKLDTIISYNIDTFVEDRLENMTPLQHITYLYGLIRPWNSAGRGSNEYARVHWINKVEDICLLLG